jgi:hypothetical protein
MKPGTTAEERPAIYPDRLDFALKGFVRMAWASSAAERTWGTRFARVRAAVTHVEWMSVAEKLRPCALFQLRSHDIEIASNLWAAQGLSWRTLNEANQRVGAWWLDASLPRRAASRPVVVGREPEIAAFARAWDAWDHLSIGGLLGYPPCCRLFFEEVCVVQRCIDTVWAMAQRESRIEDRASGRRVEGPVASNILLQALGVRGVPHCPCSFECRETARLADSMNCVAAAVGNDEEYGWLSNILSWPMEWSALHGIAEIRTPILKLCTPTDATASEYVVRWEGSARPAESARGIGFPYTSSGRPSAAVRLDLRESLANGPAPSQ